MYVECLVAKFDDKYVEQNALDRNTAICLFQRIFGEHQEPKDGFAIDQIGSSPGVVRALRRDVGVREADLGRLLDASPTIRRRRRSWAFARPMPTRRRSACAKGVTYELELRTTGEFTLRPLERRRRADDELGERRRV